MELQVNPSEVLHRAFPGITALEVKDILAASKVREFTP
jgi:hypothetical protein